MSSRRSRSGGISLGNPAAGRKGPRETDCCGSCFPDPDVWPQSDERQPGWSWYFRGVRTLVPAGHAELWLQIHGDVANLVEKESAAIRELKPAALLYERPRESPLLVAEQFTFHQTRRNRRTVQADKCALPPRAEIMKRSSHQLLARTGLAMQQHGGTGWRNDRDLFEHFTYSGTLADYVFEVKFRFDFRLKVKLLLFQIVARCPEASVGQSILRGPVMSECLSATAGRDPPR